ncbi:MAG: cob(I)yrinic acid a,c-diamide adenosyltransferase [Gammaproteobacteria bacterium]
MDNERDHQRMSQRRKAGYDKKQAKATQEKGLLMVYTGPGKGKSTAAFGMGLRILGHGMRLGVVQFIKGAMECAERRFFSQMDGCEFTAMGDGFTWITQNRDQDILSAQRAWDKAQTMLESKRFDMLIFDELNIILHYGYLELETVLAAVQARQPNTHVVITGRNAPEPLIEQADLVSEIRAIKHPYKAGIKAQAGVEF